MFGTGKQELFKGRMSAYSHRASLAPNKAVTVPWMQLCGSLAGIHKWKKAYMMYGRLLTRSSTRIRTI